MIRIVLADDHQSLIDGLVSGISDSGNINVIGTAQNGTDLVKLVRLKNPDVVVTDIRMPGIDGKAAVYEILKYQPLARVIAFSMFDSPPLVKHFQEIGARGYVFKSSPLSVLIQAIETVAHGGTFFEKPVTTFSIDNFDEKVQLSKREQEILELIAKGQTSIEIATALNISKTTVDTHRKNILQKLNLDGRADLVRFAVENKFNL